MYTLKQWLDTRPQPFLEGLAELWGIEIPTASHKKSVEILARAMPGREAVSCVLSGCSQAAREALAEIMGKGGMVTRGEFSYEHGRIRPMGPGALMREKPWRAPANVAEELWYRGLIMESTEMISGETAQVFVIPHELRPWIPVSETFSVLFLPEEKPPTQVSPSPWTSWVDMTLLLAFVYLRRLRLRWDGRWHGRDRCDMASILGIGVEDADEREGRFGFFWTLAQEMGLLAVEPGGVVMLHRQRSMRWLEKTAAQANEALWKAWVGSARWNDLCRTPELECRGRGWKNDPVSTRRRFLASLIRWTQPGRWYSLARLVGAFERQEPDFQRPSGDYRSWSVRSRTTGEFLAGREHWNDVEGALIRFFVTGPMRWLGAVDTAGGDGEVLFRWTVRGDAMASGDRVPEYPREPAILEENTLLLPWTASPRTVFRAARIADFASRDERGVRFRLTSDSLTRAYAQGITPSVAADFVRKTTGRPFDRETLISLISKTNGAQEGK